MGRNGAGKTTTHEGDHGPDRAARPASFSSTAPTSRGCSLTRSRGSASALPRKTAASSPISPCWKISTSAASRRAASATARRRRTGTKRGCCRCFRTSARCRTGPGGRMSGGEQQMLTVARTLMGNPLLILLDEPSEGVAPLIVEQMADTIIELKRAGVSILLSEQNVPFRRTGLRPGLCAGKGPDPVERRHGRACRQCRNPASLSTV